VEPGPGFPAQAGAVTEGACDARAAPLAEKGWQARSAEMPQRGGDGCAQLTGLPQQSGDALWGPGDELRNRVSWRAGEDAGGSHAAERMALVTRLVDDRNDAGDTFLFPPGCGELIVLLLFRRPYCYITWPLLVLALVVKCNMDAKPSSPLPAPPPKTDAGQPSAPTQKGSGTGREGTERTSWAEKRGDRPERSGQSPRGEVPAVGQTGEPANARGRPLGRPPLGGGCAAEVLLGSDPVAGSGAYGAGGRRCRVEHRFPADLDR
jgi:hypothetical protein